MEPVHAGPRLDPPRTYKAQMHGFCHECEKPIPKDDRYAWRTDPDKKHEDDKDFRVHPNRDCWWDVDWEMAHNQTVKEWLAANSVRPPSLDKYDKTLRVVEDHGTFKWMLAKLVEEYGARRRYWEYGKYLKVEYKHSIPVVYVFTELSRHVYTYPKQDARAEDWEVV